MGSRTAQSHAETRGVALDLKKASVRHDVCSIVPGVGIMCLLARSDGLLLPQWTQHVHRVHIMRKQETQD